MMRFYFWAGAAGLLLLPACTTPAVKTTPAAGGTVETNKPPQQTAPSTAPSEPDDSEARLKDGAVADLVIYFPSWEYIGITKPLIAEGPFLKFMNREQAETTLKDLGGRKNLAIVICDLSLPGKDRELDMENWVRILKREGYARAVFVRKEPRETMAEADILADESLR